MISIRHLRKEYPSGTPLRDVDLEIARGEVISVIGPSGTGKTTLLRCINMLERPTSGTILVDGVDITARGCRLHEVRRKIGMVFQSYNLFEHMNVLENAAYAPRRVLGLKRDEAERRALEALEAVGLGAHAQARPDELSGGQKQRAAIARALVMRPELLLFDEPTSALDPAMTGQVLSVLRKLSAQGMTMMIVTHEMELARELSTRVLYMDQGVVYEDGTPEQIFEHPQRNRTRQFVQRMKVWERRLTPGGYDPLELCSQLELFGREHGIRAQKCRRAAAILEKLCTGSMLPRMEKSAHVHFLFECSERDEKANVTLLWKGDARDPLEEAAPELQQSLRAAGANVVFRAAGSEGENSSLLFEDL